MKNKKPSKAQQAIAKLRQQRDLVISIIRNDWRFPLAGQLCTLVEKYLEQEATVEERAGYKRLPPPPPTCQSIGHCAVGALLFAAGVSNKYMERYAGDENRRGTRLARIMERRYGLDIYNTAEIETRNDADATPQARKKAVISTVRDIYRGKIEEVRWNSRNSI